MSYIKALELAYRYIDGNVGTKWYGVPLTLDTEAILIGYISVLFRVGLISEKLLKKQGLI